MTARPSARAGLPSFRGAGRAGARPRPCLSDGPRHTYIYVCMSGYNIGRGSGVLARVQSGRSGIGGVDRGGGDRREPRHSDLLRGWTSGRGRTRGARTGAGGRAELRVRDAGQADHGEPCSRRHPQGGPPSSTCRSPSASSSRPSRSLPAHWQASWRSVGSRSTAPCDPSPAFSASRWRCATEAAARCSSRRRTASKPVSCRGAGVSRARARRGGPRAARPGADASHGAHGAPSHRPAGRRG